MLAGERARDAGPAGLVYVARSETRADRLARAFDSLFPDLNVVRLPAWDCLPYDRAPPSRETMGKRLAALLALAEPATGTRLVLTTIEAVLQRLPAPERVRRHLLTLSPGDAIDLDALRRSLTAMGYVIDERVDEPGEAAIRGEVVDIFGAAAAAPTRIEHSEGRVVAIHGYDAASQRTIEPVETLVVGPASEILAEPDAALPDAARADDAVHRWPLFAAASTTLLDLLPGAEIVLEPEVEARRTGFYEQIAEAFDSRRSLRGLDASAAPPSPETLYLDEASWKRSMDAREVLRLAPAEDEDAMPLFAESADPMRALRRFAEPLAAAGMRFAACAGDDRFGRRLLRSLSEILATEPEPAESWEAATAQPSTRLVRLPECIARGFRLPGICVVAAGDLSGSDLHAVESAASPIATLLGGAVLRIGDAVVHEEHGVGRLAALETVDVEGRSEECIRIEYHGGDGRLVSTRDLGRVWRYGAEAGVVTLDRLDGDGWRKRRADVLGEIETTAGALVALAAERLEAVAPAIEPPQGEMARFAARFAYAPTADQQRAVDAALADLASGRPMDRLVCGDVGFGKTEVALRAAAAAAFAGYQVAVAAPTTVLARQHLDTFRRRFAGFGIEVAGLSRLNDRAETARVEQGLADGSIRVAIGTQALAGKGVAFAKLGLVVIDEEQRFGMRQKDALQRLGSGVHRLTMTATPIPRTLQQSLVGLRDLSLIATPPVRRVPVATFVLPFDPAVLRDALRRERKRGGRSFVVVPRIADLDPLASQLSEIVPELTTTVAHGRMKAAELDDAMLGFAEGKADVLLATDIVETGLDVPAANTMVISHPDRFGIAQLHQLRGRVGRGRIRAVAYLMTEPGRKVAPATERRLAALAAADRLGAGFALSARDLDLRGAGDLVGEAQAGHMKLIGMELYQHLLERGVAAARGQALPESWDPSLTLGTGWLLPADYVPEPDIRLGLYRRLLALDAAAVDGFAEELEDRFGALPDPVSLLLAEARLRARCRALGIGGLEAGPRAVALRFHDENDARLGAEIAGLRRSKDRLILDHAGDTVAARLQSASAMLDLIEGAAIR